MIEQEQSPLQEKERGSEGQKQYSEAEKQALILEFLAKNDKDKAILTQYWNTLEEIQKDAEQQVKDRRRTNVEITSDLGYAKEVIEGLMKDGNILPIITIPRRYWTEINRRGFVEAKETSYIPGFKKLIGSIGILPPFLKDGEEDRILCEVQCESTDLEPRATGENDTFHGIIGFREDRIPLDRIRIKQSPPFLSS